MVIYINRLLTMSSIYTSDLLAQRSQIQSEIQNLEKSITEKRVLLGFLENLIKQAELRDTENKSTTSVIRNPKDSIISATPQVTVPKDVQAEVIEFLVSQPWRQARTAAITSTLAGGNRDGQLKVSNAINQLCKHWKIQIIKEYDSTGAERQRNRLYQLTSLV